MDETTFVQGNIVTSVYLNKVRDKVAAGLERDVNLPFEIMLRHKDMVSKPSLKHINIQTNLGSATVNETVGQAGVETAIFSV